MQEFLDRIFLDNSVREYLIVCGVVLLALFFKRFVSRLSTDFFLWFMRKLGRQIDRTTFRELVLGPIEAFLFLLITYVAITSLNFPKALDVKFHSLDLKRILDGMAIGVLILFFFRMLLRGIDYMAYVMEKKANLTPDQSDNQLVVFFKDFLKVILVIICILALIRFVFNKDITKVLAGLSIVGAAIALAARESLENLIASFIIFFDRPFTTGDLVKVSQIQGTVERIGLRSTRIRTVDKTYVTVPNKQMVDSIVDNLTLRTQRRGDLRLELDLQTTAQQAEDLVAGIRTILGAPAIVSRTVYLSDISADAYVIQAEYFTGDITIQAFQELKQAVNLSAMRLLQDRGIEVAGAGKDIRFVKKAGA
jgi:MscS family membrane protein